MYISLVIAGGVGWFLVKYFWSIYKR